MVLFVPRIIDDVMSYFYRFFIFCWMSLKREDLGYGKLRWFDKFYEVI